MFEKDQVIGRHYKILSRLGTGGMGQVFKAQDVNLGREVAIKFLLEDSSENHEVSQRFLNEGRVLATLNHRCVITVFASDIDENHQTPFLVMEFVDGKSLDHFKQEYLNDQTLLLRHMIDLLEGIHACHQKGIIHRDLKPQNVLVNKDGQLKILDFGIAKTARKQTRTGVALGTPHYMAPEQCLGKAQINAKSDVYAIGIMFWEFLTGNLPFDIRTEADDPALAIALMHLNNPPPLEELRKTPAAGKFAELLNTMLAKKPEERPEIPTIIETLKKELVKRDGGGTASASAKGVSEGFIGEIYKLEKLIGEGGMGRVMKALDTSLNRVVAIKLLNETASKDESIVERFIKEGQLLATVGHSNVLNIYASSRDRETRVPFLVMEYVDGILLSGLKSTLLKEKKKIVPLMLQLFEGIKACHDKGIIHRDLKPSNLMVTREGILKIFDFGIAKTTSNITKTGTTVGTPQYMSPEQCTGAKDLTAKSDVYSMGVIFWELIFGEVPFQADDQSNPELSIALKHIQATLPMKALSKEDPFLPLLPMVIRMLDKDPAKRPSVEELIQTLDEFAEKEFEIETEKTTRRRSKSARSSAVKEIFATAEAESGASATRNKTLAIGVVVALLAAGAYFGRSAQVSDTRTQLIKAIDQDLEKGDLDAAADRLPLLEKEQDGAVLAKQFRKRLSDELEARAVANLHQGRVASAIPLLERVVQVDPGNASCEETLNRLLAEQKAQIEKQKRLEALESRARQLLPLLGPASGTEEMASISRELTATGMATVAAELDRAWTEAFVNTGTGLTASEPSRAIAFFEDLKKHGKGDAQLEEHLTKAQQSLDREKSRLAQSAELTEVSQVIERDLNAFSGTGDPAPLVERIDKLVLLGEPGAAGRYRRQLAEKILQAATAVPNGEKKNALILLQKAGAVFPELPGLKEQIQAAEEAVQNEKIAAERAAALTELERAIDAGFQAIKPPEPPTALLRDIARLETEFFKNALAVEKRTNLLEKYRSHAGAIQAKDPAAALECLQVCLTIQPDHAQTADDINGIKAAVASQAASLAAKKRIEEIKSAVGKLVKSPGAKTSAKLPELLSELAALGQPDDAEKLRKEAFSNLKSEAEKAKTLAEIQHLLDVAGGFRPSSLTAEAWEKERKAFLEKRKKTLGTEITKAVDAFKPAPGNHKALAARLKDNKELKELLPADSQKKLFEKLRDKYLAAVKPLEEKDPKKALEILAGCKAFEGLNAFPELKEKEDSLKAVAETGTTPVTDPDDDPDATPDTPDVPDAPPATPTPPATAKVPEALQEIVGELESKTSPEAVEGSVDAILQLTAALEKAKAKKQAQVYKEKAVFALIDNAEENASNGAMEQAKACYQKALRLIPNHPGAVAGLKVISGGKVEKEPEPEPEDEPEPTSKPTPTVSPTPSPTPSPSPTVVPPPEPPKPAGFIVGPGGFSTLAEALKAAPDGATVKVKPGQHACSLVLDRKITIEGDGSRDAVVLESSTGPVLTLKGGAVSGVTIRFAGSSQTDAVRLESGSPTLKNCVISSKAAAAAPVWSGCIAVTGGSPTISGNRVSGSNGMGILIRGGSPKVSGNTVEGCKIYGLWVTDGAGGTISGNTISRNGKSGVGIKAGANPTLSKNTISGNTENGIFIYEGGRGALTDNTITGNQWWGLQANDGGSPGTFSGNSVSGNQRGGVNIKGKGSRVAVAGNTIANNKGEQVKAEQGGTAE